jgi:hypothetical protein
MNGTDDARVSNCDVLERAGAFQRSEIVPVGRNGPSY